MSFAINGRPRDGGCIVSIADHGKLCFVFTTVEQVGAGGSSWMLVCVRKFVCELFFPSQVHTRSLFVWPAV